MKNMRYFRESYLKNKGLKVLDVGSQDINGSYKKLFSNHYYVGFDRVKGKNVDICDWDELEDSSFDTVVSGQAFEHIKDDLKAMAQIERVLKPGSYCCIIAPSCGRKHCLPDYRRYQPEDLKNLVKKVGLSVIETWVDPSCEWQDCIMIAKKEETISLDYSDKGDMAAHKLMIYSIVRGVKPKRILEIGIRSGISTMAMCKAIEDGRMDVDYHCCDVDGKSQNIQSKTKVPLSFHIMLSDELAYKWDKDIDILFIDGSHQYAQVIRDYVNFSKFVRSNGFIFLHDTNPPSKKYMTPNYCWDAYKVLEDLKVDPSIEFVTFPYSYGLTVCRKK